MKTVNFILAVLILSAWSLTVNAQNKTKDYFVGTWELLIEGTPQGDGVMIINFERDADGKLTGTIGEEGKNSEFEVTRVEEKAENLTLYFISPDNNGYEVYVFIEKKGDDNVSGNVMSMFDLTGKRIKSKDNKKK
jgi:hypothetical protein